ncbi:MAG: biotin synthase BioB [Verrucomicrobiota bacterium]
MATVPLEKLESVYHQRLFDLIAEGRRVFREHWPEHEVQLCTLLSIKTGGCSEDCGYCAQSARYNTGLNRERLLEKETILEAAHRAKENGSTRFCMGAAWKGVREGEKKFEQVLDTIREVSQLDLEVCVTLGDLSDEAARQLRDAGVTAYNHNIDTSPEYYDQVVTTHSYEDRLRTIRSAQDAGMAVCCGGILGMGETEADRLRMLQVLTGFDPAPESIPINLLVPIEGTPMMGKAQPVEVFQLVRLIATTRIFFPKAKVRLSAGRESLSREAQALCFFAGANSIFYGEKLLTTSNPQAQADLKLLEELDLGLQQPVPFHGAAPAGA